MRLITLASLSTTALLSACLATTSPAPSAQSAPSTPSASKTPSAPRAAATDAQTATSRDGSFEGEVTGKARPGSAFAQLRIGMDMEEVQRLMGRAPERTHTHESGKRWIPFYFGNDARRLQALYRGEGCLSFTGGNVWGSAGGDLIAIHHDATNACYQP